ncbi:hypothetical protein JCGZ_25441 [Jatropha curcas]|uniref:Uncharacterized protein n=1 Tax=Jatropha curcas TaxID=180498 RepID=A0A067JXK2_JATCU|nr:hypothetical protein JCGZ_25441 [Jatropha curcas]
MATGDVFNKSKDKDGNFQKAISYNVKGILSLYEASFVSVHGEDILDEALAFTKPILESSLAMQSIPHHLAQHIRNALILSFHKGVPRVEARQYISVYEEDESRNETLLEFAKLDFNRVQLLHRQELGELNEQKRGDYASSVECYKKEYGVTEEVAVEEILEICVNAWKDINEECMRPNSTPRPILECLVNMARVSEVVYRFDDGYTNPLSLKDKVISLFLESLALSK